MNNDNIWGNDAPQDQDRWNGDEIAQQPVPHYEHYQMHRNNASPQRKSPEEKRRKKNRAGRRVAGTVALAAVFGLTASAVFQLSNITAEKFLGNSEKTTETVQLAVGNSTGSTTDTAASEGTGTVAQVAESAMPSVVAITSVSIQEIPTFFGMYGFGSYETQQFSSESSGSGIIVGENDDELLIATNNHVVEDATTLSVFFIGDDAADTEETYDLVTGEIDLENTVTAKIKGTDATNDLAVVAVQKTDIPEDTLAEIKIAQIGDSEGLQVGEQVVAIGNALGYGQSVTSGWVSALDRSIATEDVTTSGLIQTDAAINPGNSGGALLNMKGELIGINSAKYADNAVEGMGYAIPVSTAQPILEKLMNRQTRDKVEESQAGYLGVQAGDMTAEALEMYNMPAGAFVLEAVEGDPAANAGIQRGDVIVELDGQTVTGEADLIEKLSYYAAGETVSMIVSRADNGEYVEQEVQVTLGSRQN